MTLRVITMFGKNITWYNKKNFLSLLLITSMFQVWILKQKQNYVV